MADALPRLFNIAAGQPFLACLARVLIAPDLRASLFGGVSSTLADTVIFVPTRRAKRALEEVFLAQCAEGSDGASALILPQIRALGDLAESDALTGETDYDIDGFIGADMAHLPPPISAQERKLVLSALIREWAVKNAKPISYRQSLTLAATLGAFLDRAQNDNVELARLRDLVPEEMAQNWQLTLEFLQILQEAWPHYLETRGLMDAVARRNALIDGVAEAWARVPPTHPVIAAGSTGSVAATARLLGAVARLPMGAVVLPGLDTDCSAALWEAILAEDTHPQNGMARLLDAIDAPRQAVRAWPDTAQTAPRVGFIQTALLPAAFTHSWADWQTPTTVLNSALDGLEILHAPDESAEAGAIAVLMRGALEAGDTTTALVTPDRNLARRVKAELARWSIEVDDSAGQALADTEAAGLMRRVLAAAKTDFAPIPLLALLKHPMVLLGDTRLTILAQARALENTYLRGPRRITDLHALIEQCRTDGKSNIADMLESLARGFAPLLSAGAEKSFPAILDALCATMDALSATDEQTGAIPTELLGVVEDLQAHAALAGAVTLAEADDIMTDALRSARYRPQGRNTPGLYIWGPLEARLMQPDTLIIGGLNEGVWPPSVRGGPWLSRTMRATLDMASPEQRIGQSAHDFYQMACAPRVILTRTEKQGGTPMRAARWVRRVETLAGAELLETKLQSAQDALQWWQAIDACTPQPATRPMPCPPVEHRPKRLSVTQIETLLVNPYASYARHILKLQEWEDVDAPITAAHRGQYIHELLDRFARGFPRDLPSDIPAALRAIECEMRRETGFGAAVMRFWQARLESVFDWFDGFERTRRASGIEVFSEVKGDVKLALPNGEFTVSAKADRIERYANGRYAVLDYKTGAPPAAKSVREFWHPQLSLEAAILAAGGFAELPANASDALVYVRLGGGYPPGDVLEIDDAAGLAQGAADMVRDLATTYSDATQAYLAHPRPRHTPFPSAYDHLARLAEWQTRGEE